MMERLSDLMRFALQETNEQEVKLAKEIHLIKLYLGIQQIRFADKLSVAIDFDDSLANALVPSMILQPLVENSIKYAVENSTTESEIIITAAQEDERLTIVIKDQGTSVVTPFKKGIGINNTEERLQKLYGKNHFFSIKPYSGKNTGIEVVIKIPLHYG
jgi:LytS/YehU family sensor histidine kinase